MNVQYISAASHRTGACGSWRRRQSSSRIPGYSRGHWESSAHMRPGRVARESAVAGCYRSSSCSRGARHTRLGCCCWTVGAAAATAAAAAVAAVVTGGP